MGKGESRPGDGRDRENSSFDSPNPRRTDPELLRRVTGLPEIERDSRQGVRMADATGSVSNPTTFEANNLPSSECPNRALAGRVAVDVEADGNSRQGIS